MLYHLPVTGKQLKKQLENHGWLLDRISGSHHIMIKEGTAPFRSLSTAPAISPKGL
jgi:predicted RNA binding protein YcfA (HicA-like mRNA interferase family)